MSEATDLFGFRDGPAQGSLFGADELAAQPARGHAPNPETIRARLAAVLARARAAPAAPWPEREARLWRTVFPQLADWLPDVEAERLRRAFAAELERISRER